MQSINDLDISLTLCAPCHVPKAITSRPLHFLWQPPIIRLTSTRLPGHREPLRGDPSADYQEAKTTSPDRQDMVVRCGEHLTAECQAPWNCTTFRPRQKSNSKRNWHLKTIVERHGAIFTAKNANHGIGIRHRARRETCYCGSSRRFKWSSRASMHDEAIRSASSSDNSAVRKPHRIPWGLHSPSYSRRAT